MARIKRRPPAAKKRRLALGRAAVHLAPTLPGKEQKHGENTSISRYVWLPIEWQGEKPVMRWRNEWSIE